MSIHHSLIETYDVIEQGDIFCNNNVIVKNKIINELKNKFINDFKLKEVSKTKTLKENTDLDLNYIDEEFIEKILLSDKEDEINKKNNKNFYLLLKYFSVSFYFYLFMNTYL